MDHRRGVIVSCAIAIVLSVAKTKADIGWEGILIPSHLAWWFLLAAHAYNSAMWFWVSGDMPSKGSLKGIFGCLLFPSSKVSRDLIGRISYFLRYGIPTWAAFVGLTITLWYSVSQLLSLLPSN